MKYSIWLHCLLPLVSPPSRGAWIEIPIPLVICRLCSVAPLAGGVD